jgi:hypothetical protein
MGRGRLKCLTDGKMKENLSIRKEMTVPCFVLFRCRSHRKTPTRIFNSARRVEEETGQSSLLLSFLICSFIPQTYSAPTMNKIVLSELGMVVCVYNPRT